MRNDVAFLDVVTEHDHGGRAIAAVSAAGLAAERFLFLGFLPTGANARRELLAAIAPLPVALVIYEAWRQNGFEGGVSA